MSTSNLTNPTASVGIGLSESSTRREAPQGYWAALDAICQAGLQWPCLIGVDGLNGAGKSAFANWLAWQISGQVLHLDLFLKPNLNPPVWREDLGHAIDMGIATNAWRSLVVEGSQLLQALNSAGRSPDFVVTVVRLRGALASQQAGNVDYLSKRELGPTPHHALQWSRPQDLADPRAERTEQSRERRRRRHSAGARRRSEP